MDPETFSTQCLKMAVERKDDEHQAPGRLLDNLVLFGRLLRGLGFDVSSSRMISIVKALEFINIAHKADFYHTLSCLLVRRQEEILLFDQAFALFWKRPGHSRIALSFPQNDNTAPRKRPTAELKTKNLDAPNVSSENLVEEDQGELESMSTKTYSQNELLRHKDFAEMDAGETDEVVRRLGELIWQLGARKTRRKQAGWGPILDFRKSFRGSLRYGGELLVWSRKKPKLKPRSLVILADISGSMEQYTRMLLHFAYLVTGEGDRSVEAFVFSTSLTRITRQLRNRNVDAAMQDVGKGVPDWSGGTRIGEAVKSFNYDWARRLLTRGAVVLLISDGWDRGDPDLLRREMSRLQRSCHRLIWLNPLLGSPQYEPLTRGMQAALPFVDDFMPIHNLSSLEELTRHLARIDERPSSRSLGKIPSPTDSASPLSRMVKKDA
jgi:uncharacterized protein with von Willebrand factor type A (vWA) domain